MVCKSGETKEYLEEELAIINKWEEEQKGLWFWEKLGRLPFKILDRITPQIIHNKIGMAIDEIGSYLQTGGRYLVSEMGIFNKISKKTGVSEVTISYISELPLTTMDEISQEIITSRKRVAMTQGATTGIGGVFTLTIDIPFILGISLKTLQEIALSYGFDPNDKKERVFIVKCLQFVSSDIVGKQAILRELSDYSSLDPNKKEETLSQVQGWREVIISYRDNFGWKKLFQMIPIAGMIFGSIINKSMVNDIGETGRMLYKKRRIKERLKSFE
ncbi:EcsC family protein [Bacillus sp. Marseille-P3661]|uniref:EcsC family protein n=1 Tax=Bacillus sp. Marseille-P3661 TaxID=1936234 RepID=UPI000C844463|nr:EcsC family protein [Bacillus sp. Marseille-P3661]